MSVELGRQVSNTFDGIRDDHKNRYIFALTIIGKNYKVIDAACGIGYGSKLIAEAGNFVDSFDISPEALNYALKHYSHERITYSQADIQAHNFVNEYDFCVSFETVEHLETPETFLKSIKAKKLIVSVPNESYLPFDRKRHVYHKRHYTESEFCDLLTSCGWKVSKIYHQIGKIGKDAEIQDKIQGNTIIAIAESEK